jgi:hypothetical protein
LGGLLIDTRKLNIATTVLVEHEQSNENMNNPTLVSSSRNSQARFRLLPFTASRVGKLAACLILLASSAQAQPKFTWSAPVPFGGTNADYILTNFPGTRIAAAMSAGGPTTVTLSTGSSIVFTAPGVWADLTGGNGTFSGAFSLDTGNANFNTCLNSGYYDGATHTITMNNLVVGKQYSVQLFALDDRSLSSPAGSARTINWQDPNDATDISATYAMADNAYIVGTFTAADTSESIQENMLNSSAGNFNCLVLRAVGWTPAPSIAVQPRNSSGFLGESANLTGSASGDPAPTYQWEAGPAGGPYTNLVEGAKYVGTTNATLTINNVTAADAVPVYVLVASNPGGSVTSKEARVFVQVRAMVGHWFTNSTLADVSGYQPAGTHDGYDAAGTGSYVFTNDVPINKTGQSLLLYNGDTGIAISNSSTADLNYTNTFDERINNTVTVGFWAKGWPSGWSPFVSKFGETTPAPAGGWQFRQDGQNNVSPCWTVRGAGGGVSVGTAVYNNPEDLAATGFTFGGDTSWHLYVGTLDVGTGVRNLYVDGVLGGSETNNGIYTLSADSHLVIGAREAHGSVGSFFTGEVYDVRVYNYALSASEVLDWYGVVAPAITLQPKSVAVFDGAKAQFTVNASGTPPLAYQWRLNGTNVNLLPDSANFTGANSNVLTVLSVTTNDLGSYHLIVTSTLGYGTATSSNALLAIVQKVLAGEWFTNGTLTDLSGHTPAGTHDGYAIGAGNYVFTNDVPPGETGQSIQFPTSDSGIAIANSSTADGATYTNTFDSSEFSVAFWAKDRGPGGPNWIAWVAKDGYNNDSEYNGIGWSVGIEAWSQHLYFDLEGIDNGTTVYTLGNGLWGNTIMESSPQAIPSNNTTWHHYAATYSPVTRVRNLYFDGVLVGQHTNLGPYALAPDKHLTIGGQEQTTHGFTGFARANIYDVRVYNYSLNSAQIVALLPDPVITVQPPQSLNAYVGVTAHISATVMTHTTPVTNQWQLNGTNLVDGAFGGAIISGSTSTLTIANVTTNLQGVYRLIVSDPAGMTISSNTTVTVLFTVPPPATNLVGAWLTGAANLADTSGYQPAGTHDGYGVTGSGTPSSNYGFTNDVPPGATGQSLTLQGNTAIAITNSSDLDGAYTNTFDDTIGTNGMTVTCWAKGLPGGWNPWVSKYGENGAGWQLRVNGDGATPCWTIRGTGGTEDMSSTIGSVNTGWHFYAGTYSPVTGDRSLYVDGVLAATQTGQGPLNPSAASHVVIGARDGGGNSFGNYFTGEIYGVRIYNTDLSQAQVNSFLIPTSAPVFSGPPVLNGNKFVLTYTGTLLSATNVAGPYLPVAGATSPYTNNVTTAPQMFFRLSNP